MELVACGFGDVRETIFGGLGDFEVRKDAQPSRQHTRVEIALSRLGNVMRSTDHRLRNKVSKSFGRWVVLSEFGADVTSHQGNTKAISQLCDLNQDTRASPNILSTLLNPCRPCSS